MIQQNPRRRVRPRIRSSVAAALALVALASTGLAMVTGSASGVVLSELDLAWTDPPASVGNGDPLRGAAHVNLNDHLGEEGVSTDHVVTFTADGGVFTRLPSACRTDGDPASIVAPDGSQVRCNLGRVRYGTAIAIDFAVVAHAGDGGTVSVSLTDGTTTATVPPIPVSAPPGIEVIFNEAQRVQANTSWEATFPIALALPAGSADLRGPITFDVAITNKTSTNAPSAIEPSQERCVSLASTTPPSSMPPTTPQAPVPSTCTVTKPAAGILRVTIDGYRSPAAVDPPTTAADGSSLPTDTHVFAAFGLPLHSRDGVSPTTSAFNLTVEHVSATTQAGRSATEANTSNNTEAVAITAPGGYSHNWAHAAPDGTHVVGGGGPWAASYYAAAGDQILSNTSTGVWGGRPASQIPAGASWSTCEVLDGPAAFDGFVQPEAESTNSYAIAALPAGSYAWSVYRGPLPPSGARDTFDCGTAPFLPATTTTIGTTAGECACAHEERLTVSDLASVTALKLTVDPAAVAKASPLGVTPPRIGVHVGAHIASTATAADAVWTLGSVTDRSGAWQTASEVTTSVTPTPGLAYGSTNALRDVMRLIGTRPYVDKTVDHPDVRAGDIVTYSVRTGAEADLGTGSAAWTVTDTIPAGVDYVDASASINPDSVDRQPGGNTVLTWSMSGPVNTDTTITYRARIGFTTGTRTNTAVASIATIPGGPVASVQTDSDTATVAYAGDGRTVLTKAAGSATFAAGGANTWTLDLENLDTVDQDQTDVIDVLPWNGDPRGSSFHGRSAIDHVSENDADVVYYATAIPSTINADPGASANGAFGAPSAMWSTSIPDDTTTVTAIRIVGRVLAAGARRTNTITWHAVGGRAGDRFENMAWAKATHTRLQMIKAAATSTVADGSRLQISKAFGSASGWTAGGHLSYRITVHNPTANVARDVRVHDVGGNGIDPQSVTYTDISQGAPDPTDHTWAVGDLAGGATVSATVTAPISADVDRSRPVLNVAYVENPSNPYDPTADSGCQRNNQSVLADTDQCDAAEVTAPVLRIDKRVGGAAADGTVTWSIRVRVDGTVGAHDVRVLDTYPEGLDRSTVRVTAPPTAGSFDPPTGIWKVDDLEAGATASVTFQGHVEAPSHAPIVNLARVESPDVVRPQATDGASPCQPNDGPTPDAALDADTDQCDLVEILPAPPKGVVPASAPPAHTVPTPRAPKPAPVPPGLVRLPDTGGPSRWIGVLAGSSAAASMAVGLGGRRRGARAGGVHRG